MSERVHHKDVERERLAKFHSAIRSGLRDQVNKMLMTHPHLAWTPDVWGKTAEWYAQWRNDPVITQLIKIALAKKKNTKWNHLPVEAPTPPSPKKPELPTLAIEESLNDFRLDPLQEPVETVAEVEQEPLASSDVELLVSIFPDLPRNTLELALVHSQKNVQAAIDFLLGDQGEPKEATPASTPQEAPEVQFNSEEDFPSLTPQSKPAVSFQPPRLGLLNPATKSQGDQMLQAEVESVEWVDYDYDEEYEEVPDVDHVAEDDDDSSGVLIHGDNWDVVSHGSEMSFLEVGEELEEQERSAVKPTSFSAALKQNLDTGRQTAKVKAPRLPRSTFAADETRVSKALSDQDDDEQNDLFSPKDSSRVFGRQSKPWKNERATFKPSKKSSSKQTRGIC